MSAGSAGCEKHSSRILQHQEPLLHHCPVNATRGKWGMECSSHVHIQGLAGKQEPPNNGAASSPEHGARWRLLTKCLMDTAAFPHSSSLTAGGRRTAVAATLCCPLAHSSRVVAQFLSLPDSPIASAHFSCWVSHQTCQDFSVCLPRLIFFFQRKYLITMLNNLLEGQPWQLCEILAPKQTHIPLHLQISFSGWWTPSQAQHRARAQTPSSPFNRLWVPAGNTQQLLH